MTAKSRWDDYLHRASSKLASGNAHARCVSTAAVARLLKVDTEYVRVERESQRPYSYCMVASIGAPGKTGRFFVKHSRNDLRRQHSMLVKANSGIRLPYYHRFDVLYESSANVLVLDYFEGITLKDLVVGAPLIGIKAFRAELLSIFERIGEWLRAFHEIEGFITDCRPVLQAYLDARAARVGEYVGHQLQELASDTRLARVDVALSHGDFTPQNILVNRAGHLAVVDFGINEWDYMSPSWDLQSFLIGLGRILREAPSRRLRGWRLDLESLGQAMLRGYDKKLSNGADYAIVGAIRHISFLAGHLEAGTTSSSACRWHRSALMRVLDRSA